MGKPSPEERKQLARDAAMERWRRARARQVAKDTGIMLPGEMQPSEEAIAELLPSVPNGLPIAKYPGRLAIGIPVYVLNDQRSNAMLGHYLHVRVTSTDGLGCISHARHYDEEFEAWRGP
jgi:hypothetical protein